MIVCRRSAALILAFGLFTACASEVVRHPVTLRSDASAERPRIELAQTVTVESSSGFTRELAGGSVWGFHGSIPQGSVYKRVGGIFTIEGAHFHEAFLVISGNRLVGFYLPVERAFSPSDLLKSAKSRRSKLLPNGDFVAMHSRRPNLIAGGTQRRNGHSSLRAVAHRSTSSQPSILRSTALHDAPFYPVIKDVSSKPVSQML